jgi:hypothetical protein
MSHAENELDAHVRKIVETWQAQILTNRELVQMMTELGTQLPPIVTGDLDPNTGLRYTPEAMKR